MIKKNGIIIIGFIKIKNVNGYMSKRFKEYINETFKRSQSEHINKTLRQSQSDRINEWKASSKTNSNIKYEDTFLHTPEDVDELHEIIAERLKENIEKPFLLDIDVSNITDFSSLFSAATKDYLKSFYNIDTTNTKVIDISTWKTKMNPEKMDDMFFGCFNLKEIKGIEDIDTSNVVSMIRMFKDCHSLEFLNLSKWKLKKNVRIHLMFTSTRTLELSGVGDWIYYIKADDLINLFVDHYGTVPSWWDIRKYKTV